MVFSQMIYSLWSDDAFLGHLGSRSEFLRIPEPTIKTEKRGARCDNAIHLRDISWKFHETGGTYAER